MGKIFFISIFVCVCFLLPSGLQAVEIDILSEEYKIAGAYDCQGCRRSWSDSYELYSNSSATNEICSSGEKHLGLSYSSIGSTGLHVSATQWSTNGGSAWAMARGTWTFRPTGSFLGADFTISGRISGSYPGQGLKIMLIDMVTGEKLIDEIFTGSMSPWYAAESYAYQLAVDPTHDYSLCMKAKVRTFDDLCTYIDTEVSFMPEPATIAMLGLGVLLLRRKSVF